MHVNINETSTYAQFVTRPFPNPIKVTTIAHSSTRAIWFVLSLLSALYGFKNHTFHYHSGGDFTNLFYTN